MPRDYTTITTSIWDDADFCALSAGAQRTYFMLVSQKEITACGTLALTLRRWAKTCSDKDLDAWLAELSDHAFVLIDDDQEEVLIRTFAKWDGGYKHSQRVKAVVSSARAVRSPLLRDAVAAELAKLGVSIGTRQPPDTDPSGTEQAPQSGRSVVTEVGYESTPHSTLRNPQEGARAEIGAAPSPFCSKHPNGTEKPCGACGTAKLRYAAWMKSETARAAERRKAAENCPDCHGGVWLDDGSKCDHRRTA